MTKRALLNGHLIQLQAETSHICNLFIGSSGRLIGLGYVPDLNDAEFEQIDLNKSFIYPNVGTLSVNALERSDLELDVACRRFAWSCLGSELTSMEQIKAAETRFSTNEVPVTIIPDLTIGGQYLTPLEEFYRQGYTSFYQDLSELDIDVFHDAIQTTKLLEATVLLDLSDIPDQQDLITDLCFVLSDQIGFKGILRGVSSFEAFQTLMVSELPADCLKISCDLECLKEWASRDFSMLMTAFKSGRIVAVSSTRGTKAIIETLLTELQCDYIQISRLLAGANDCLSETEFKDFSGGERPSLMFYDVSNKAFRTLIDGNLV